MWVSPLGPRKTITRSRHRKLSCVTSLLQSTVTLFARKMLSWTQLWFLGLECFARTNPWLKCREHRNRIYRWTPSNPENMSLAFLYRVPLA